MQSTKLGNWNSVIGDSTCLTQTDVIGDEHSISTRKLLSSSAILILYWLFFSKILNYAEHKKCNERKLGAYIEKIVIPWHTKARSSQLLA